MYSFVLCCSKPNMIYELSSHHETGEKNYISYSYDIIIIIDKKYYLLFFKWTGKFLFKSKTNYKEIKSAFNLITDTHTIQRGSLPKSKEPYRLLNKGHFANVWAQIFALLETQLKKNYLQPHKYMKYDSRKP